MFIENLSQVRVGVTVIVTEKVEELHHVHPLLTLSRVVDQARVLWSWSSFLDYC